MEHKFNCNDLETYSSKWVKNYVQQCLIISNYSGCFDGQYNLRTQIIRHHLHLPQYSSSKKVKSFDIKLQLPELFDEIEYFF